ncbi:MAG TPA: hypothetical protein VG713_13110 [Pirellulales bacterium]|nr:hypothetical protein [Pirellulales bacterium]
MIHRVPLSWAILSITAAGIFGRASVGSAADPSSQAVHGRSDEVSRLLVDLNADEYETRRHAFDDLRRLGEQTKLQPRLAHAYARLLTSPDTSLEVREAIGVLLAALPASVKTAEPADRPTAADVETESAALLDMLGDSRYSARAAAAVQLEALAAQESHAVSILVEVKRRLAESALDSQTRRQLEAIYERARGTWLLASPPVPLPAKPTEDDVRHWIADYVRGAFDASSAAVVAQRRSAERELLDALAQDDLAPLVDRLLRERLADATLQPPVRNELESLDSWMHPAMVAEYWILGRHTHIQHLLIGVPNQPAGAERPSLFDRCDDRVAHCASGNSLSTGDYPVGVFIPHPKHADAQFHLINLPTPRRRMAYEYLAKTDTARRLSEISRRTVERLLATPRSLEEREIVMLRSLDATVVSRFAGQYLLAVDDQRQAGDENRHAVSRHALVALVLAQHGTHEALADLAKAVAAKRFLPTPSDPDGAVAWIAALAIVHRDRWSGADDWLVAQLGNRRVLLPGDRHTTVAAAAAGMLLARHEVAPASFGLEIDDDPRLQVGIRDALVDPASLGFLPQRENELLDTLDWPAYRWTGEPRSEDVLGWWHERQQNYKPNAAARTVP